ncbi:type II toxin-antitoxin system RelE/ParE family toxin [Chamaesiphon sp.]|uniref:type II toxin-antitoxin system RelE/ParE family toxin n=1 Tax=Chamaesiphon sp. TaxID=2814140 RepID=UPI0035948857
MEDKPINWIGSSLEDLCSFSEEARRKAGFELRKIQQGQDPTDFKPMSIVGKGVQEIRIRTEDAYRIFYVAKFAESIYVLHTFQKKTQKTAKGDIELGQKRYEWMLQEREQIDKENN